jgi:hypothetical protein
MDETLTFSFSRLATYLACQRRFQLRYLDKLAWPVPTSDPDREEPILLGQAFHQMMHRHFLGLSVADQLEAKPALRLWWERFVSSGPTLPAGKRLPEITVTAPLLGGHVLTGRFDLVIIDQDKMHLFDWKSDRKILTRSDLKNDLQSRVYLALAAEGASALGREVKPEQIALTYWNVNDPEHAILIGYNQAEHDRNWRFLVELAGRIERQGHFPLTEDLNECRRCLFQIKLNWITWI